MHDGHISKYGGDRAFTSPLQVCSLYLHLLTVITGLTGLTDYFLYVDSQTFNVDNVDNVDTHRAVCLPLLTVETMVCEGIYLRGWAMAVDPLNSCVTFVCLSGFD